MATKSISQMNTAVSVENGSLLEVATPDAGSASGYKSEKISAAQLGDYAIGEATYPTAMPNMQSRTVGNAIETLLENFAPIYDDTATYSTGDICTYNGALYKANTDIDTPEAFDVTKWDTTTATAEGGGGGTELIYSDEEVKIGKWFGKDLFQKVISYTSAGGTADTDKVIDSTLIHGTNCFIVSLEGVYGYGYMNAASHSEAPRTMNGTTSPEPLGQATLHLPWYGGGTTNAPMIYCYNDGIHFMKNGGQSEAKSVSLVVRYVKRTV